MERIIGQTNCTVWKILVCCAVDNKMSLWTRGTKQKVLISFTKECKLGRKEGSHIFSPYYFQTVVLGYYLLYSYSLSLKCSQKHMCMHNIYKCLWICFYHELLNTLANFIFNGGENSLRYSFQNKYPGFIMYYLRKECCSLKCCDGDEVWVLD